MSGLRSEARLRVMRIFALSVAALEDVHGAGGYALAASGCGPAASAVGQQRVGGVDDEIPCSPEGPIRQGERAGVMVGVDQQQERVVDDVLAELVAVRDAVP